MPQLHLWYRPFSKRLTQILGSLDEMVDLTNHIHDIWISYITGISCPWSFSASPPPSRRRLEAGVHVMLCNIAVESWLNFWHWRWKAVHFDIICFQCEITSFKIRKYCDQYLWSTIIKSEDTSCRRPVSKIWYWRAQLTLLMPKTTFITVFNPYTTLNKFCKNHGD